jgi:S-adenosylmethionine hydrolase
MSSRRLALVLAPLLLAAGCASSDPAGARSVPVVLMTDFGLRDDAVGLLRGAVLAAAPDAQVLDLTHEVPRYEVDDGARLLAEAPGVYPPGTVFVVVVDPGVGTTRRPIAARLANGTMLVGPDNGVLSVALERHGPAEVRVVDDRGLMRGDVSTTFHGRDVFAPVGGHLAAGVPFESVGPVIEDWVRLSMPRAQKGTDSAAGLVVSIDEPFGNVWTNIPGGMLADLAIRVGDQVEVLLHGERLKLTFVDTFGDVPVGQPLLYVNSRGDAALALNMGDFARTHQVKPDVPVKLWKAR